MLYLKLLPLAFLVLLSMAVSAQGEVTSSSLGVQLAAQVHGVYTAPPRDTPSGEMPGGPIIGNGDIGIVLGGPPESLTYYIGKSDFWGIERGAITAVGKLSLSIPALSGASYHVEENIGPATVTGKFTLADGHELSVSSWAASADNLFILNLHNTGTLPLTLGSKLFDGLGSSGNAATFGTALGSTWLKVSPDNVAAIAGSGFNGKIAGLNIYGYALSPANLSGSEPPSSPAPYLPWNPQARAIGQVSLDPTDRHGGSASFAGDSRSSIDLGVVCIPQKQFTVCAWIQPTSISGSASILQASTGSGNRGSYPFFRGLLLGLDGGKLTSTLNYTTVSSVMTLPIGQWVKVAVVYDGSTLTLYSNGQVVGKSGPFPTIADQMGFDKTAIHLGDKELPYAGCAPFGLIVQRVVGAVADSGADGQLNFTLPAGASARIQVAVVTDRNTLDYVLEAQKLAKTGDELLASMEQKHAAWWASFWSKSFVQIPDSQVQDSWYGSLYLLACCSKASCPPPGLWGNFITSTGMAWYGDYTLDYNYQAPFWAAYATNHYELADNYEGVLLSQMSRGEATAQYASIIAEAGQPGALSRMPHSDQLAAATTRRDYKGIYFYTHLIPTPGWSDDYGTFWGQKSNALFAAVNLVQRWRYTHDLAYAKEIYPYLKGVADFWDSYLVTQNGKYVSLNDAAWENSGRDTNPATTLSFIRLMYPALLEISQLLHLDADLRPKWEDVLGNLSSFTIVPADSVSTLHKLNPDELQGKSVVRCTEVGTDFPNPMFDVYHDLRQRGSSAGMNQTQAIFPGWSFGLESSKDELDAALNTVTFAAEWYDFNDDCSFYPSAAAVGYNPAEILENLDGLLSKYQTPNFLIHTGGGGTEDFAIVPATLANMFLQSYQTNIHIFPDWPIDQDAAFGNLNACGGFLISSKISAGKVSYVRVHSSVGLVCRIVNPWPAQSAKLSPAKGRTVALAGQELTFSTKIGGDYTLTPD